MSSVPGYSREQLRQTYVDAWRKRLAGAVLSPLEALIADVIGWHPEYHRVLEDPAQALSLDPVRAEADNPFLHLGLHLAVREQIAVDRPPGVRGVHGELRARLGDAHRAEHVLADALAETLWDAQRLGTVPDETRYLNLARKRARGTP